MTSPPQGLRHAQFRANQPLQTPRVGIKKLKTTRHTALIILDHVDMTRKCQTTVSKEHALFTERMKQLSPLCLSITPQHSCIALADLHPLGALSSDRQYQLIAATCLSKEEALYFSRFKYAKRKKEWLGGRLAAKHCLTELLGSMGRKGPEYRRISILPDRHGRPQLHTSKARPPLISLSISHSHQYCTAMASTYRNCGIDIQKITPQISKVQDKFTNQKEMMLHPDNNDNLTDLTLIWAAKESLKKSMRATQPSIFTGITLEEIHHDPLQKLWTIRSRMTTKNHAKQQAKAFLFKDYVIACTITTDHA